MTKTGILINACYGGYSLSAACCEEFKKRTGGDIHRYDRARTTRMNPTLIELFHEFGSEWMSGIRANIQFVPFIEELLDWVRIDEYDGMEDVGVDIHAAKAYFLDQFMTEAATDLASAYEELRRKMDGLKKAMEEQNAVGI